MSGFSWFFNAPQVGVYQSDYCPGCHTDTPHNREGDCKHCGHTIGRITEYSSEGYRTEEYAQPTYEEWVAAERSAGSWFWE